jgi:1A family penicillin-binding protein
VRRAVVVVCVAAAAMAVWTGAILAFAAAWQLEGVLDRASGVAEIAPRPQATVVFDRGGRPVFSFYAEQRLDVPLDRVSPRMIDALLSVEDRRFYSHHGLDAFRIVAAAVRNVRAGRILEGGSTLTQQLARTLQLSPERTYTRKIREAAIAAQLESRYGKDEILAAYLNAVYFGNGYYGIEAASRGYFGKAASDLDAAEAATLAGIVRSPRAYAPSLAPRRALARRNLVLRLMRESGRLDETEYRAAVEKPLNANRTATDVTSAASPGSCGAYYQEAVRRELVARFGGQQVLRGGLRVYTGYDRSMQCAAEQAIAGRIAQIVKVRPAARDLQGSLVSMDPLSGDVRALVGGRDFGRSSFDRTTQAHRQAGSAFKPIIYAAALEHGYAPASILRHLDAPISTPNGPWLPGGAHEQSEYTLRAALKISSNRAAAQLLQQVGISSTSYLAERLGIASRMPNVPSLALGTGEVTLMELTSAYGVFANEGMAVAPHLIARVEDRDGRLLWTDPGNHRRAVSEATAFMMSSMLADVIASGTATTARASGFRLPAAGKTGTTDDFADAWFIGYTPHLVTGVWFGMDRRAPIMNRGFASVVAVPAWAAFMKTATAGDRPDWYQPPPDVEKVAICRLSGERATDACRHGWLGPQYVQAGITSLPGVPTADGTVSASAPAPEPPVVARSAVVEDYFPIGTAPTEFCPLHGAAMPTDAGSPAGLDGFTPAVTATSGTTTGTGVRPASERRLIVDRIVRPDGTIHYVVRQ